MLQIKFNQKRHDAWIAKKTESKKLSLSGIVPKTKYEIEIKKLGYDTPLFKMYYRKYRTIGNDYINAVNKALEVIRGDK